MGDGWNDMMGWFRIRMAILKHHTHCAISGSEILTCRRNGSSPGCPVWWEFGSIFLFLYGAHVCLT